MLTIEVFAHLPATLIAGLRPVYPRNHDRDAPQRPYSAR